jgi:hypothetical protein
VCKSLLSHRRDCDRDPRNQLPSFFQQPQFNNKMAEQRAFGTPISGNRQNFKGRNAELSIVQRAAIYGARMADMSDGKLVAEFDVLYSPNMNPIEHVWKKMKEITYERYPHLCYW